MNMLAAAALAVELGGDPHDSGGGIWLVLVPQADGTLRVVSDESNCVYASLEAFEAGDEPTNQEAL